jgi:hypothetical protein
MDLQKLILVNNGDLGLGVMHVPDIRSGGLILTNPNSG